MWAFKIIYCAVMCLHIIDKDDNGKVIDMEYMYMYVQICCAHFYESDVIMLVMLKYSC